MLGFNSNEIVDTVKLIILSATGAMVGSGITVVHDVALSAACCSWSNAVTLTCTVCSRATQKAKEYFESQFKIWRNFFLLTHHAQWNTNHTANYVD